MKKSMFMVAATLGMMIASGAFAQQTAARGRKAPERPTAEELARRKSDRMKQKLNLSEEQAQQIYRYNVEQFQQLEADRKARFEAMAAARKAETEKRAAVRKAETDRMKNILSPEQFGQWEAMQRRPNQPKMHRKGAHKHPHGMQRGGKFGKRGPAHRPGGKGRKPERQAAPQTKPEAK